MNLDVYEDLPFFDRYIRDNYTDFAQNKIRYNTALGLNEWKIKDQDKMNKVYLLEKRNPAKEQEEDDIEKGFVPKQSWQKLKVFNDYVFCTCMDYFNSGIPCAH